MADVSRRTRLFLRQCLICVSLPLTVLAAEEKPVGDRADIVIGQSIELSGLGTGKENVAGAAAYFNWVNSNGGVHGRRIRLVTYDDMRKPEQTRKNTEKLLKEDKAIALFGYRGTPTVEAVLPLLVTEKAPMIAPFTGAYSLHSPFNPYLFHLRASYRDEAAKMVDALETLKIRRVAILYQDDAFGHDGLAGFQENLKKKKMDAVAVVSYDRKTLDVGRAANEVVQTDPQAVLMACSPSACANFIKLVRKAGRKPQFISLSNVNSAEFFSSLGDDGRGIGVMQVMPYPKDISAPVVREFQRVRKEMAEPPPLSYAALEGFVAAKLTTEALRRAGPHPSRAKLHGALEGMKSVDLGGIHVSYSPTDRYGSHFVELIVIGTHGAIWR